MRETLAFGRLFSQMHSLEKIAAGARKFRTEVFPQKRSRYRALAKGQSPHTLLITCADSRITSEILAGIEPGEIFVERNPGALVPVHSFERVGVSASIEYAVDVLGVENVIVCGHSDCGAVKGLLKPSLAHEHPAVGRWLEYGAPAVKRVAGERGRVPGTKDIPRITEVNVLVQIEHLRTHPCIARRLGDGTLRILGWVFDLEHGEIRSGDLETGQFLVWP